MRRDLLLLTQVILVVMLTVFSITSQNASAHDMPLQGNAQGAMPQSLQEKMQRLRALVERLQQQVLEIEAEVCVGRHGAHLRLVDRSVGIEREGDVGVGAQLAILPAGDEGVVLPVLEVADE